MAFGGTVTLGIFILVALFGPILVPFDVMQFGIASEMLMPPSAQHILGTDDMG